MNQNHIPMTAPKNPNSDFETKEKLDTIQLLPQGPCIGILVNIIDIGTHETNFKDDRTGLPKVQRKLHMTFEFNGYKQYFYVGDTVMMPTTIHQDYTYYIARYEKTNNCTKLLEIIEQMIGKKLTTRAEWDSFDVSSLLGMPFVCQIVNNSWIDKTTNQTRWGNNISSFAPYNPNVYNFPPEHFQRTADLVAFSIDGHGFNSPVLDLVPGWIKGKIRKSHEFAQYAANGGKLYGDDTPANVAQAPKQFANSFAQGANAVMGNQPNQGFQSAPVTQQLPPAPIAPQQNVAPVTTKKWLNANFTYEQMIQNGWNDEQLVQNGYMEIVTTTPTPVAPVAPPAPVAPSAPPAPANTPAPFAQNLNNPITPANSFQQAPPAGFQQAPQQEFNNNLAPVQNQNGVGGGPEDDLPF